MSELDDTVSLRCIEYLFIGTDMSDLTIFLSRSDFVGKILRRQ
jgi:hypothetical protein